MVKPKYIEGAQYVTDAGVVDTSYIKGAYKLKHKNSDKKKSKDKDASTNQKTNPVNTSTTHYKFLNALPQRQ